MIPFPIFMLALITLQPTNSSQRRPPKAPEINLPAAALDSIAIRDASPSKPLAKPEPDARTRASQSLVNAELAFAKMADEQGTQAAFLNVLDDMGVLFRPGPVVGKAWLRQQKPDTSKLSWFPSFVEVSEAGDLGYSTGPYQWRADVESKQVAHGHFVSVWGQRAGKWKLLLDMGSPHAAAGEEDPVFEPENEKGCVTTPRSRRTSSPVLPLLAPLDRGGGPVTTPRSRRTSSPVLPLLAPLDRGGGPVRAEPLPLFSPEALQNLEREFSNAAAVRGILSAYNSFLAPGARVYRAGSQPTTQLDDIRRTLEQARGKVNWTCLGSAVAKSHDLGYAYGLREYGGATNAVPSPGNMGGSPARNSFFLHVWKRQASGRWKVILDIENFVH